MTRPLRQISRVSVALLCFLLASCGERDTHQKIMVDSLALMEKVATTLETVKNEDPGEPAGTEEAKKAALERAALAKAAAKKIDALVEKFDEIAERTEALGKPSIEIEVEINEKNRETRKELHDRIKKATDTAKSLGDPTLLQALDKLGKSWKYLH